MKNWIFIILSIVVFLVPACSKRPVIPPTPPEGRDETVVSSIPRERLPKPYRVGKDWYHPLATSKSFKERGIASWYGQDFHGKRTSSGEIYDMHAMTAAHKLLPLGTFVRVTNLQNSRVIEVRVNDRGPFVRGRVIDLSYAAAQKLGIVGPGTAHVEVIALGTPAGKKGFGEDTYIATDYFTGNFSVQVGAFQNRDNAVTLRDKLAALHSEAHIAVHNDGGQTFYRVRVGRFNNLDKVMAVEQNLIDSGYSGAFSVAE